MKALKIRGHHLLCIPRFYSGGYDKKFAENMKKVCMKIRKNPDTKIKLIVGKPDALCFKCPNLSGNECVLSPEINRWVTAEDEKAVKYLKLKENAIYKARDVFNLSMEKVNPKTINTICHKCIWLENCLKVRINNSFRKDLNKK